MARTLEEIRDDLLKKNTASEDISDYKKGYIDGALDMYNEFNKEEHKKNA